MRVVLLGPFGLRLKMTMARRALPLARALAAGGHAVRVVLPPWDCPQDSGRSWREEDGVEVVNVRLPPMLPLLGHLWLTARLLRSALGFRPDVIHCFKPKAYAGLAAVVLWAMQRLYLWRGRLVVDSDDWEGWGGWNEIGGYAPVQRRFFAWQERWGLTHADALTVASRALQTIAWSLGVPPHRVFYVPNGITQHATRNTQHDSQITNHKSQTSNPQSTTLLLYTRFFEFTLERVVEVLRRVQEKVPAMRVLVVGKGLFGEEKKLLALAAEAGLTEKVNYVGWVSSEELPHYFASADVAIYPYDDTLINRTKCSVKLIDLMAAGLPIVADDVGQNGVYIKHGTSGFLVEPGDTAAFAGAVIRLLKDHDLRERLGGGARQRVRQYFTWDRLVDSVEAAYRLARGETGD